MGCARTFSSTTRLMATTQNSMNRMEFGWHDLYGGNFRDMTPKRCLSGENFAVPYPIAAMLTAMNIFRSNATSMNRWSMMMTLDFCVYTTEWYITWPEKTPQS